MVIGDYIGRIRGAAGSWMRASADLAAIAALRGLGFARRDAAGAWRVVSATIETDADGYTLVGHDGDTVGERVLTGRIAVKTSNQNSTASYANDTGVAVALRTYRRYQFRHFFMFSGGTGNIEVAYTWPTAAVVRWHQAGNSATAYITTADEGIPWGVQSPGREVEHRGYIQTAGTAGDLQARFRHATDTKSMESGSHIILYDLGPA